MQRKVVLITGATGYLGCHLAYAFLKEGYQVIALVRETGTGLSVSEKARRAIAAVNKQETIPLENLIAVPGDVAEEAAVLAEAVRVQFQDNIDEIWHCAVTFNIQKSKKHEVEAINIKGTQNMLDLTLRINSGRTPRFFYVSTAYSSGREPTVIREEIQPDLENFRSLYEWSKHKAEKTVECYQDEYNLDATIFRPSIVVGSPATRVISNSGYYRICQELYHLSKRFEEEAGSDFDGNINIRLLGNPEALVNIVPVDYVIQAMRAVAGKQNLRTPELKIFNIINENPPSLRLVHKVICESLNITGLYLVEQDAFAQSSMSSLEKGVSRKLAFQMPYMNEAISFSNDRFREAVPVEELPNPATDDDFLRAINRVFFDHIEQEKLNSENGNTPPSPKS